ncbi:MAG: histidine phosphatase family protein [Pseudomonadota bacterium]
MTNEISFSFFFARHGQTEWNAQNRFVGRADVPLNPTGTEQAKQLAKSVSELDIDLISTSPLLRAKETAKCVSDYTQIPVRVHHGLAEVDVGYLEGRTESALNFVEEWRRDRLDASVERYQEVSFRVRQALRDIREQARLPLVVAHSRIFEVISGIANLTTEREIPNAKAVRISISGL